MLAFTCTDLMTKATKRMKVVSGMIGIPLLSTAFLLSARHPKAAFRTLDVSSFSSILVLSVDLTTPRDSDAWIYKELVVAKHVDSQHRGCQFDSSMYHSKNIIVEEGNGKPPPKTTALEKTQSPVFGFCYA